MVRDSCDQDLSADAAKVPYFITSEGVFFINRNKEEAPPIKICSPLHVIAKTRDDKSGEWGRLLQWMDDDGNEHQWAMPLAKLEGDGQEVRQQLASGGVHIGQQRQIREHLALYIKTWPVEDRATCVDSLGWHGRVYVTSAESVGDADERILFQGCRGLESAMSSQGTAQNWRQSVATLAAGNSRFVFAISAAFAGPLLALTGEHSGGFHFRGASSSGKSTALKLAASVWGKPKQYMRLWRSTLNGLEGLAALHNDGVLILDEIGQMNPAEAGEAAYMLSNEQGKARAGRNGMAVKSQKWRLLFLSAGEEALSSVMAQAGKKMTVGQEIRFADIEADSGCSMGMVEALHGRAHSGALIADALAACEQCYGAIGQQWLNHLVIHREGLQTRLRARCDSMAAQWIPPHASGQVARVAHRFALVAQAGELATEYGLTGWAEGEAEQSAKRCFFAWLEGYGGLSNQEDRRICEQVRGFLAAHGSARFQDLRDRYDSRIPNRLGYWRQGLDGWREFLIQPEAFKGEVCRGLDFKRAVRVLADNGILERSAHGNSHTVRLPDVGPSKVYVLRYRSMEMTDEGQALEMPDAM